MWLFPRLGLIRRTALVSAYVLVPKVSELGDLLRGVLLSQLLHCSFLTSWRKRRANFKYLFKSLGFKGGIMVWEQSVPCIA